MLYRVYLLAMETSPWTAYQWSEDFFLPPTPDEIPLQPGQRLVALGDIHGDLRHLTRCLVAGNIIPESTQSNPFNVNNFEWIAGDTVCVQVGDVLDRGHGEESCLRVLLHLARQAQLHGGALVMLWGNHEVSNVMGDFECSKDSTCFKESLGSALAAMSALDDGTEWPPDWPLRYGNEHLARRTAFAPGGPLAIDLLSKLKVVVKVGRSILVHAGITAEVLEKYGSSISTINQAMQDFIMHDRIGTPHGQIWYKVCLNQVKKERESSDAACNMSTRGLAYNKTQKLLVEDLAADAASIINRDRLLYMRDYSLPPDDEPRGENVESAVDRVLALAMVDRIVVGHTVQSHVNSVLDGKVWRVDIGNGIPLHCRFRLVVKSYEIVGEALQVLCEQDGNEVASVVSKPQAMY